MIENGANNINQIAVHVNSTDNIYTVDFAEITKKLNCIWRSLRFLQSLIMKLKH